MIVAITATMAIATTVLAYAVDLILPAITTSATTANNANTTTSATAASTNTSTAAAGTSNNTSSIPSATATAAAKLTIALKDRVG